MTDAPPAPAADSSPPPQQPESGGSISSMVASTASSGRPRPPTSRAGARPSGPTWPPPPGPPSTLPTPTPTPRAEIRPVQLSDAEIRRLCTSPQDVFLNQPNVLELEAPIKVCGFYQCRWGYHNLSVVEDVMENYWSAQIPLDVIWNDDDHMDARKDLTLSSVNYSRPKLLAFLDMLQFHC
ncbi:hypothetical protein ZWY2020_057467 [Hordeum vulgare]|nr:hypothetical protein ZWY2020_057467 [Hordeum vulgare]